MSDSKLHDTVAELCFKHFQNLPKTGKPKDNEWTILSCIVLEENNKFDVVALGTGTKCIGQNKMSADGDILNDSHAEVICRRAFMRFIYEEMLQQNGLFTFDPEQQKFEVKPQIKFHFFSTQVPCGDAAIFPKQDIQDFGDLLTNSEQNLLKRSIVDSESDHVPTKKLKSEVDIFRTGAKCLSTDMRQDLKLEGANFHVTGVVRTKPGRGPPTLSVSCSDKVARWCHLGVQGALLSIFLKNPIYFSSFTISGNTPYNEDSVKRALFGRLGKVTLESPFYQCNIILGQAKLSFNYNRSEDKNPCSASVIWLKGKCIARQVEVAVDGRRQGVTQKKLKTSGALQICKIELFKKFIEVIKRFEIKLDLEDLDKLTYKQAKMYSQSYQKYWSLLKNNFKCWTVKDENLLNFTR